MNPAIALRRFARNTAFYRLYQQQKALRALARWTPLDQKRLDFYKQFLGPNDLAFDVGANMGNRTRVFRMLCERVVAIEPQRECVRVLKRAFGSDRRVVLVDAAVGAAEGEAELQTSSNHVLATLSREWIETAQRTGRFGEEKWGQRQRVRITTLDELIKVHGAPDFLKIDVEGYEESVLEGLSRPVRALSLEFVPERLDALSRCMTHLKRIGTPTYNFALAEETRLRSNDWLTQEQLLDRLARLQPATSAFGDVYARFA
jgi:FkbM family methyltransferase